MHTGRNDPCPCGSGKKFKHCCGGSAAGVPALPTADDRAAAFDLVDRLALQPRFDKARHSAHRMIWRALPGEVESNLELDGGIRDFFIEWFWFDYLLPKGRTIAEHALREHPGTLPPGGRRFLQGCIDTPLRMMQVQAVEPGVHLVMRDVLERGPAVTVNEKSGSRDLLRHDIVAVRAVDYGVARLLEGVALYFPVRQKTSLANYLRRQRKRMTSHFPPGDLQARFARMTIGASLIVYAIEAANQPAPRLTTMDGDELALATARFEVVDAQALERALDAARDLQREEADDGEGLRYAWLRPDDPVSGESATVLGHVVVAPPLLRVETLSMARARLAQVRFADLTPGVVRFKAIDVDSLAAAMGRPRDPKPDEPRSPEMAALERDFMERHYRDWIDRPVPALGNRTPRDAVRSKHLRPKVLALVEGIENQAERLARDGRGFDAGFLRAELGLMAGTAGSRRSVRQP